MRDEGKPSENTVNKILHRFTPYPVLDIRILHATCGNRIGSFDNFQLTLAISRPAHAFITRDITANQSALCLPETTMQTNVTLVPHPALRAVVGCATALSIHF